MTLHIEVVIGCRKLKKIYAGGWRFHLEQLGP
jgi:hypothetical protein